MVGINDTARAVAGNAIKAVITHAQLHTAAAGAAGTSNVATGGRKSISWGSIVAPGDIDIASPINFTGGAANGPVHSVTLWSASSGGTFYGEIIIVGSATFDGAGLYTLSSLRLQHG